MRQDIIKLILIGLELKSVILPNCISAKVIIARYLCRAVTCFDSGNNLRS